MEQIKRLLQKYSKNPSQMSVQELKELKVFIVKLNDMLELYKSVYISIAQKDIHCIV
jgi:hypothetical protein